AGIHVRRVDRLVVAAPAAREFGAQATGRLVASGDEVPVALPRPGVGAGRFSVREPAGAPMGEILRRTANCTGAPNAPQASRGVESGGHGPRRRAGPRPFPPAGPGRTRSTDPEPVPAAC